MQTARHPEVPERKQNQHSEPPQLLSKMTNREQEPGMTFSRGGSILQHLLMPLIHSEQMTSVKKAGARAWRPGPEWKGNGRELRWDWGGIVKTFDLFPEGSSVSGVTPCVHPFW
jgi:hypothetical protein